MRRVIAGLVVVLTTASVGWADTIVDDFNDGLLGTAWQVITQSEDASWNESGGTLNVGGHIGKTGELVMRYNQAIGDVGSVRIDYNWISCTDNKARVYLGLWDSSWANDGDGLGVYIKGIRHGAHGSLHSVDGGAPGDVYAVVSSVPPAGSFMIERNGNDFQASYLNGGDWQLLFKTRYDFAGTSLYPYLVTSNSNSNPGWQVALDNFSFDTTNAVPAPSAIVSLLGLGMTVFGSGWWQKRRGH